ncbi:MAG: hypothetical protein ABI835_11195 [Chloroflexota bacterium]
MTRSLRILLLVLLIGLPGTGILAQPVNENLGRIAYSAVNTRLLRINADGLGASELAVMFDLNANAVVVSPDGLRIALVAGTGIYLAWADGSHLAQLSGHTGDGEPAWSPNGQRIAFISLRDGGSAEIYVINADGSNQTRLTNNHAIDLNPVWMPDGEHIAFRRGGIGEDQYIYVMNADGSNETRVYDQPGTFVDFAFRGVGSTLDAVLDFHALNVINLDDMTSITMLSSAVPTPYFSLSPDGQRIAYISAWDGVARLVYTVNADGSERTRLADEHVQDFRPVWSPDGQRIAYVAAPDQGINIYLMNADGSNQTYLAEGRDPTWSPDGKRIVFASAQYPDRDIFVINQDGSEQTQLTSNGADECPVWSPDGQQIAFVSNDNLDVMDADGTNQTQLAAAIFGDTCPSWSPDGKHLAFTTDDLHIHIIDADGANEVTLPAVTYSSPQWLP